MPHLMLHLLLGNLNIRFNQFFHRIIQTIMFYCLRTLSGSFETNSYTLTVILNVKYLQILMLAYVK